MNYNSYIKYDFNSVAKFARDIARKEQPKASRIWDFLTEKSIRDYLNLCYAYLRWIDDIVDNPSTPCNQKRKFIEEQRKLISHSFNEHLPQANSIEEACLFYFAKYAISSNNLILIEEVKNMVEAIGMDVNRLEDSGIFSNEELDRYIELMSKSFFNFLCIFAFPKSKYREEYYLGTKFTTLALMIRDLEEDIDLGFINIGAEDIYYYKIDLKNIKNDKNFSIWLNDKIKYIFKLLYNEAALIKSLPLKFRIFTYYSLIYRLPWVVRAKVYDYSLDYICKKSTLKELKTYFLAFIISINIFIKAFIHTPLVKKQKFQTGNS